MTQETAFSTASNTQGNQKMTEAATLKSFTPKNIATWTSKDKSLTVQIHYSSLEELILERYKLQKLDQLGDVSKDTELFQALSDLSNEDVIKTPVCGKCGCEVVQYVVRVDKDENKYYEQRCSNTQCRSKLAFGANKKGGGLFSKKKNEDGTYKGKGGWTTWNKEKNCEE